MAKQIYKVLKTFYRKTYKKWSYKMDFEKKTLKYSKNEVIKTNYKKNI